MPIGTTFGGIAAALAWMGVMNGSTALAATAGTPTSSIQPNAPVYTVTRKFDLPFNTALHADLATENQARATQPQSQEAAPIPTTSADIPSTDSAPAVSKPMVTTVDSHPYSKVISCVATAYSASASENPWGSVDYFGHPLALGTIAVDPSVIPLGSTAYITGYTFDGLPGPGMLVRATDEGGAIQGNRIDIFVPGGPQVASGFGFQNVKVYILKQG